MICSGSEVEVNLIPHFSHRMQCFFILHSLISNRTVRILFFPKGHFFFYHFENITFMYKKLNINALY